MQPLHITVAEAKPILKAAYEAGTLSAQGRSPRARYFDQETGNRCAIGQLFSVEDAKFLENRIDYALAGTLIERKELVVDDPEWFIRIQKAHDGWSSSGDSYAFREMLK